MSDDKEKQPHLPTTTVKGRGAVLTHGRPTERQPLRKPGAQPTSNNSGVVGNTSVAVANNDPVATFTSTLSPHAAEFVPIASPSPYLSGGAYDHYGFASSTSSSATTASSSATSPATVASKGIGNGSGDGNGQFFSHEYQQYPIQQQQYHQQPPVLTQHQSYPTNQQPHKQEQQYLYANSIETEAEITIEYLRTIIYEITVNPGKFDELSSLLVDALGAMVQDESTLHGVVDQIFEQAICQANFRYNGARLCNNFAKSLNLEFPSNGFRAALFHRCQEEFAIKDELAMTNIQRLRDFTMFMGELFIHLEIMHEGTYHKVTLLGQTVPELLATLLRNPLKDNIKCVCQMLKFTGAALEDFERLNNSGTCPVMNGLFQAMDNLHSTSDLVDRNCKELLLKVIELRAIDWGRVPIQNEPGLLMENPGTDPIMYGPDGLPLSNEEALFLESNSHYETNGTEEDGSEQEYYGNTQSSWSTSDGMDEEMTAAFEKFLLETS